MNKRIELIPGRTYACGCDVQTDLISCRTHGPGIVTARTLWRVSYMERGRAEATGIYFDRGQCENTLGSFRRTGRAWLEESRDNAKTWRTLPET